MNAIVDPSSPAQCVYNLLIEAKPANLATRKQLIERYLKSTSGRVCEIRQDIMHCLYSPLRVFNVKPKKDWIVGTDAPTKSWDDAHALLLKLESREITGNAAKQAAQDMAASLAPWSADLFVRCLEKRPDAGMGATIINKEIKGYIPQFKCALAEPVDFARCEWPMIIQPKLDGVRTLVHVELLHKRVTYYSRRGLKFTSNAHLDESVLAFARALAHDIRENIGIFLDGEVFGEDFKQTISATRKKDGACANTDFHVYDFIPASNFFEGKFLAPQVSRSKRLAAIYSLYKEGAETRVKLVPSVVVSDEASAKLQYGFYQDAGYEGAVLKDPKAFYSFRRSYNWMKMKSEASEDLTVVGYEEGTGKYEGQLGALIVDFKGVEVRVGSGLTDALRSSLWAERDEVIGRLIEVEYMEVTPDGSLRHPRFVAFRDLPDNPGVKI